MMATKIERLVADARLASVHRDMLRDLVERVLSHTGHPLAQTREELAESMRAIAALVEGESTLAESRYNEAADALTQAAIAANWVGVVQ